MSFLELALSYAARGWFVHPLKPRTKRPFLENWPERATTDPERIREWWAKWPDANMGIVPRHSGHAIFDADHGFTCFEDFVTWRERNQIPVTYTVRSGRRLTDTGEPEYGVQMYFSGALDDGKFSLDGVSGDIRSLGGYVLGAGSIHPDSGAAYEVLVDAPLAPVPSVLVDARSHGNTNKGEARVWGDVIHDGEGRESFLLSEAGKLRRQGFGEDSIYARLSEINEARVMPPKPDADLKRISHSAAKYPVEAPPPGVTLSGTVRRVQTKEAGPAEVVEELDEKLAEPPLPRYPIEVWEDTLYLEFAKYAQVGNFIPLEFLVEGAMTYAGGMAAATIRGMTDAVNPRLYTVLIATAGVGKGSTFGRIRKLFPVSRLLRNVREGEMPPACSALVNASASENGLNDALLKCPRVIQEFEEVDRLLEKTEIQGSGGALMSIIRTCFDDTVPGITTSAGRPVAAELAYLSIMGATTPSLWRKCMEGRDSYGSGLGGRFNLVASTEKRSEGFMPDMAPDYLQDLQKHLDAKLNELQNEGQTKGTITTAPDAIALLRQWWNDNSPGKTHYNRVNVIAHRKALHIAWMRNSQLITREMMADALKLGEYLVGIRDAYAVVKGEDKSAVNENRVLHVLTQIAPMAARLSKLVDLLDGIMSRSSIYRALESLVQAGEIEKLTAHGDGRGYAVYRVIPK